MVATNLPKGEANVDFLADDKQKVKYHKDMWNEKDYSHDGLGKIMKTLNGDHLTKVSDLTFTTCTQC